MRIAKEIKVHDMNVIISKFRSLYVLKLSIGYLVAIACICGLSYFYQDIYNEETKQRSTYLIVIIVILTLAGSLDFLWLTKIVVGQKSLEVQSFFTKSKIISYSDIKSIERHKIFQQGDAGQISDGYHLHEIILSDDSSIIISPDKFENHSVLILEIRNKLKAQQIA